MTSNQQKPHLLCLLEWMWPLRQSSHENTQPSIQATGCRECQSLSLGRMAVVRTAMFGTAKICPPSGLSYERM